MNAIEMLLKQIFSPGTPPEMGEGGGQPMPQGRVPWPTTGLGQGVNGYIPPMAPFAANGPNDGPEPTVASNGAPLQPTPTSSPKSPGKSPGMKINRGAPINGGTSPRRQWSSAASDDMGSMSNPAIQSALYARQAAGGAPATAGGYAGDGGQGGEYASMPTQTRAYGMSTGRGGTGGQGGGNALGGLLSGIFGNGQQAGRNATVDWLVNQQGVDRGLATMIAADRQLLQRYIMDASKSADPKSALELQKLGLEVENLRNPRMSYADQVAAARLEFDRTNGQLTTDIKEHQRAVREDGYKGTLRDWILETKRAGAANISNTTNVGGEKKYDETVGEGYGKRFLAIQDETQTAQRALNALDVMERSMSDPGFYSGMGASQVTALKRAASALGMDAAGIDSMETFNAMSKQAALDVMGGSLGTGFSNADRDFVLDQVPTLQNTPEGNRRLIDVQRTLARRKQEIGALAREYVKGNGRLDAGFDEYLARWAESNPLFPQPPAGPSGPDNPGPSRVRNPAPAGRQRAHNPETGETIEWNGEEWVPAQ